MYNVPEQETKDIEERNTQEFQCVDFITKGIKLGSLNIIHVNRMGRYVKERKDKPRPMRVHLQRRIPYCEYSEIYQILRKQRSTIEYHSERIVERRNGGIP